MRAPFIEHLLFAEIVTHTYGDCHVPRPCAWMFLRVHYVSATLLSAHGFLRLMTPQMDTCCSYLYWQLRTRMGDNQHGWLHEPVFLCYVALGSR